MDLENLSAGDGESSVSDSEPGTPLPPERVAAVFDAAYEIEVISQTLQALIEERDECGSVREFSRGMLLRVAILSEAINHCLHDETDEDSFGPVLATIRGARGGLA